MSPKIVFIIPYRDRERHLHFFRDHMKKILEDQHEESYRFFFVHQCDNQPFNRGAIKNIGFLAMKKEYPEDYKKMTFVFNDIDVMPFEKNMISYMTTPGIVKHFYGFYFALGGIVSMTGGDFEQINGFPNFWAWGWEDNELQKRVETIGFQIDRSTFYEILSKDFIHLHHGSYREVNPDEKRRYDMSTNEGIRDVILTDYRIEGDMIEIVSFSTGTQPRPQMTKLQNIGQTDSVFRVEMHTKKRGGMMKMQMTVIR
jgi:hypothetical protein